MKKRIAIWAHGSKDPDMGFSGGLGLLTYFAKHAADIAADIVLVCSPFSGGSAETKTHAFNEITGSYIATLVIDGSVQGVELQNILATYALDLHFFSGWLKLVTGFPAQTCINIHPGPIQTIVDKQANERHFGGKGYRGDHVHQAVRKAYQAGAIRRTVITMHYMTEQFDDERLLIGQCVIPILATDTCWKDLKERVRSIEPSFQQYVCHQLANGHIRVEHNQVLIDDQVAFPGAVFGNFIDIT